MQRAFSKIAVLFYILVILYHPLVMISHAVVHSVQSATHHQVHHHSSQHDGKSEDSVFLHSHDEPEVNMKGKHLVQVFFPSPLLPTYSWPILPGVDGDCFKTDWKADILAFYPLSQTPPPRS